MNAPFEVHKLLVNGLRDVGYAASDPRSGRPATWRLAPHPLELQPRDVSWLEKLGGHLHRFNAAAEALYLKSAEGSAPRWIADYLELGKPRELIQYSRSRLGNRSMPTVIRPDVIPTPEGMMITELDAVPGGMGIVAKLAEIYCSLGFDTIGGHAALPIAFADMVRAVSGKPTPSLAIVVSDESAAYRAEMTFFAAALSTYGIKAIAASPDSLLPSSDGVYVKTSEGLVAIDVIYRFFELFDLPNVANSAALMELNATGRVAVVPPFRPFFEEKMWAALFTHPDLIGYWQGSLGQDGYAMIAAATPPTWILDPDQPPTGGTVTEHGTDLTSWQQMMNLGRRQRQFVIKPSGFSERAWGSRGVIVGHDISVSEWNNALATALDSFAYSPHILQRFKAGRHFEGRFYEPDSGTVRSIPCRVRLCPYYLVVGDNVRLTSVLGTMCPLDKKKIHGMPVSIMLPCDTTRTTGGADEITPRDQRTH